MSYPGGPPGDPAGQQPWEKPEETPGGFEYPPIDYGTPQPPTYSAPPGGYPPPPQMPPSGYPPPPQMPPSGYPPPPQYNGYNNGHHNGYGPYSPAYGAPTSTNGMAIGSLVASLIGIPLGFLCFGGVGSIVGIVLGIVALNQVKTSGQKGREMAIAGIALGGVGLVLLVIYFTAFNSWL